MSEAIVWRDAYLIGNEAIDRQHRRLFELAARVLEIEDPISQRDELRQVLHGLYQYMEQHFDDEEQFMLETEYPDRDRHGELHRELVAAMNHIMRASTDLVQLEFNLVDLMNRWLTEHIATEDRKIADWQRARTEADGTPGNGAAGD